MPDSGIDAHVSAARDAITAIPTARDYRGKYVHAAIGITHATCALALSIERFAVAITPKEENP